MTTILFKFIVVFCLMTCNDAAQVNITTQTPSGIRFRVLDEGYDLIALYFSVNKPIESGISGEVNVYIASPTGAYFEYENTNFTLQPGDTVNYWIKVEKGGMEENLPVDSFTVPGGNATSQGGNQKCESEITVHEDRKGCTCYPCLIFEDNFDKLDTRVWEHEITAAGGGNWEFQYYCNNRSNSYARDGKLFIKPTLTIDKKGPKFLEHGTLNLWGLSPNDICTGNAYSGCERDGAVGRVINPIQSARLRSHRGFNFRYGRLEVEAKMPTGDWLWPAIWLMPSWSVYGRWPASGEIDLVEARGNINYTYPSGRSAGTDKMESTIHWGPFYKANQFERTSKSAWAKNGTFADSFHKYRLDWNETTLGFYVDDDEVMSVTPPDGGFWELGDLEKLGKGKWDNPWVSGTRMAPFDEDFYIIMNVAVGGTAYFNKRYTNWPHPKPWNDRKGNAATDFWNARDDWLPTWHLDEDKGEGAAMQVNYVRVWKMNPHQ